MIGIAFSFYNEWLSGVVYVFVALMWLIPDKRIERTLQHLQEERENPKWLKIQIKSLPKHLQSRIDFIEPVELILRAERKFILHTFIDHHFYRDVMVV